MHPGRLRRSFAVALVAASVLHNPGAAQAQNLTDPPAAPTTTAPDGAAEQEQILRATLGHFADQESNLRTALAITGVAAGAVMIPPSVVLLNREEEHHEFHYLALGTGIGLAVVGLLNLVIGPAEFEYLLERHEARRAAHTPTAQALRETEAEWAAAAASARVTRRIAGISSLVASGILLVSGVVFALVDVDLVNQHEFATVLLTVGGLTAVSTVPVLFVETPMETSYNAYVRTRRTTTPQMAVAPVRSGVVITFGGRF